MVNHKNKNKTLKWVNMSYQLSVKQ